MSKNSFEAMKRAEARERLAALRRARKSPAAVWKEQRAVSLFDGAADKWITNLREVLEAMADSVGTPREAKAPHKEMNPRSTPNRLFSTSALAPALFPVGFETGSA